MTRPTAQRPRPAFMPPYVLERLIEHGTPHLRDCARHTLTADQALRARQAPLTDRPLLPASPQVGQPARYIYSAENQQRLPGKLIREEGQSASNDLAVDEAYRWLGATYRFFWEVFERHAIDNRGMPLLGTVHYGHEYDNAFWNGTQMVFGDGDGELFRRFTASLDVVAHELTHGVIEHDAGLVYTGQSGALNESLSDVFGSLTKQHHLGQTAKDADWLIGAELLTERVEGRAMRSLAEPGSAYDDSVLGKDPQPGHMNDYVETQSDNGGVHINSGIPNRAFYLAAIALGGYAWQRAGWVWYDALHDPQLAADSNFVAFAELTVNSADRRFGTQSQEVTAVRDAWRMVGVLA